MKIVYVFGMLCREVISLMEKKITHS